MNVDLKLIFTESACFLENVKNLLLSPDMNAFIISGLTAKRKLEMLKNKPFKAYTD